MSATCRARVSLLQSRHRRTRSLRSAPCLPEPRLQDAAVRPVKPERARVGAGEEGRFLALKGGGFVISEHARTLASTRTTSSMSRSLSRHAYLWGGRTSLGVDCSGLVQLAAKPRGFLARATPICRRKSSAARSTGRAALARPWRPRVLGRPCRHHDERAGPRARERLSHGGGGRASRRSQGAHRRSEWRRYYRRAAPGKASHAPALTSRSSEARRTAKAE